MAKLFLRNAYEFENPSRRVFLAGELFEGAASQQASKTKEYFKNGESTPEAIALAKSVEKQAEEIRKGTNKQLLSLYVDLFNSFKIPERSNLSAGKETVDAKYEKKGLLAVAAKICPMLGEAYRLYPDLQLLSYATVFNGLKNDAGERADANYLPMGASVWVDKGIVYVSYKVGGVEKTFHSELFPWSSYDVAYEKWLANQAEERAAQEAEFQEHGRPDDGLDAEGTPIVRPRAAEPDAPTVEPPAAPVVAVEALDERGEYEKRLDQKVDTFRDDHGLTEPGERIGLQLTESAGIGTYNTSLRKPDGAIVSINVRATVPAESGKAALEQALEKALDEELARLDKTLDREEAKEAAEAPTELEKDWQRVLESVQKMVAADSRLTGKVTVSEGPRNARGDDKTLIVTNTENGKSIQYRVGVKEKNAPKSYGPIEGVAADAARIEDAKSIRVSILVLGNGSNNKAIGELVSKYTQLESYRISSVEKGAYNAALIMAGIAPIEEPAAPGLIDVLFKGRGAPSERPERSVSESPSKELPYGEITSQVLNYPDTLNKKMRDFATEHNLVPSESSPHIIQVSDGTGSLVNTLKAPDGSLVSFNLRATDVENRVQRYAKQQEKAGASLTPGDIAVVRDYYIYQALEEQLDDELKRQDRKLDRSKAAPTEVPVPAPSETRDQTYERLKAARIAAADLLPIATITSPQAIERENAGYKRRQGNEELRAMETQFQDGEFRYLTRRETSMPEPGPGGTVEWKVVYDTAEGQQVTIVGKGSVDTTAVDKYIEASKAMGVEYDREAMIKYLAYRAVSADFKANTATARAESGLNEKYMAYVKRNHLDETDRERARATADQLGISTRLTGEQIGLDLLTYINGKNGIVDSYPARYPQVGSKPFLTQIYRRINDVNPNGSGLWHVEYNLPDGSPVIIRVETDLVDRKAAEDYVAARNAEGGNYNAETLIQYLGYVRLAQTFKEEWEKQKPIVDAAYAVYKASAPAAPARTVTNQPRPGEIDFDLDDGFEDTVTVPFETPAAPAAVVEAAPETYKNLTAQEIKDHYTGKGIWSWDEGGLSSSYMGNWLNGVPEGEGYILTDDLGKIGPLQFKSGSASFEQADGNLVVLDWVPEQLLLSVIE